MVTGINRFREYFAAHENQYAIIGGAACDLLFDSAGLGFRLTKDVDMVLCVEVVDVVFARAFEAFLNAGGYQARERSSGRKEFYRFHRPTDRSFPHMIELFTRRPGTIDLPQSAVLTPIPVEDDVISLSAILLEDSYYEVLQSATRALGGVTVIDETLLIPFKARAFLDLTARAQAGESVGSKHIRKHRNDVFRLVQLCEGMCRSRSQSRFAVTFGDSSTRPHSTTRWTLRSLMFYSAGTKRSTFSAKSIGWRDSARRNHRAGPRHGFQRSGGRAPDGAVGEAVNRDAPDSSSGRYTALIAGYTGAVGGALARELAGRGEWQVYGLARRPPAAGAPVGTGEPSATVAAGVTGVAADMADRDRLRRALEPLGDVTHLFYCGRATHAEQVIEDAAANLALLENVVTATEAAAPGLRHVHLVQGGKYYGVHVGPFPTPAAESQPRAPIDNFNYDQQDYLSARAATAQWTWSASRPNTLVHFSPAIARNLVSTLGAWAAICRELGAALDFPGAPGAFASLTQLTTIELLARAIAWMATEPACANEAFNVTNTDLFRWHALWPRLAEAFAMPLGSVRSLRLAEVMAGRDGLWRQVCARHGLVQPDLDRVANWGYADATLERTWDEILSHNKTRRLGFHDWDDSLTRFFTVLDQYRRARILPD